MKHGDADGEGDQGERPDRHRLGRGHPARGGVGIPPVEESHRDRDRVQDPDDPRGNDEESELMPFHLGGAAEPTDQADDRCDGADRDQRDRPERDREDRGDRVDRERVPEPGHRAVVELPRAEEDSEEQDPEPHSQHPHEPPPSPRRQVPVREEHDQIRRDRGDDRDPHGAVEGRRQRAQVAPAHAAVDRVARVRAQEHVHREGGADPGQHPPDGVVGPPRGDGIADDGDRDERDQVGNLRQREELSDPRGPAREIEDPEREGGRRQHERQAE